MDRVYAREIASYMKAILIDGHRQRSAASGPITSGSPSRPIPASDRRGRGVARFEILPGHVERVVIDGRGPHVTLNPATEGPPHGPIETRDPLNGRLERGPEDPPGDQFAL